MSYPFAEGQGPILVSAELTGPARTMRLRLILNTGATTTLIDRDVVIALGFDRSSPKDFVSVTTGSAVGLVPRVQLTRLTALGQHQFGLPVLAHSLPPSAQVFGLLGLDFSGASS